MKQRAVPARVVDAASAGVAAPAPVGLRSGRSRAWRAAVWYLTHIKMSMPRRQSLVRQLGRAADTMLQGSLSVTTRTCGRPACRCHRGQRHGPHTYLTFRTPEGRSSALYVPAAELERFQQGVAAWDQVWAVATQLAQLNREQIVRARRARARRGRDARPA